jgi:hypothetical protein
MDFAQMNVILHKGMWNGFDFYYFLFLDRINQSSLKLRPGTPVFAEASPWQAGLSGIFSACGEGL